MKIYILKCQDNKFYIGKTSQIVENRFNQHLNDKSCSWTTKYPPIKIIETFDLIDDLDEDNYTLRYMKKYGINNVRGGTFSQINLPLNQYQTLTKMIRHSDNKCFRCNKSGHYANKCNEILFYTTIDCHNIEIRPVISIGGKYENKWLCIIKKDTDIIKKIYCEPNGIDAKKKISSYLNISIYDIFSEEEIFEDNTKYCFKCSSKNHYFYQCKISFWSLLKYCFIKTKEDDLELNLIS